MSNMHNIKLSRRVSALVALPVLLALGGCGGMPTNRSLESIHQPVVTRTNYVLDVPAGPDGLSPSEQGRLSGWFEAMDLRYGDRISIDDPQQSSATRSAIEAVAAHYGLLVSNDAPITPGEIASGSVRVVLSRSSATVPGCPDWSKNSDANLLNGTSSNYGCAVNSNLAAMVADPQHLLHGASGTGETVVMTSTKAIDSYRDAKPTGEKGLKEVSSQSSSGK
jgi:pilus assembly protein CpaD